MSTAYNSCYVEIYQDPNRYNSYFCKAIPGTWSYNYFTPGKSLFEIVLNGPGKTKAKAKLKNLLATKGLDLDMLTIVSTQQIPGLVSHLVKEAPVVIKEVPKNYWRRKHEDYL